MTLIPRPMRRTLLATGLAFALASTAVVSATADAVGDSDTTIDGDLLEVVIETEGESTEGHVLVEDDGTVTEVSGDALEEIESGSTVAATVDGAEVNAATVLAPVAESAAVAAHRAYVVTIDDSSRSGDVPLATAIGDATDAADYWVREARGAISSFEVASTATLALSGSCAYGFEELWERASARFPAVDFSDTANHLIVYTPTTCAYQYLGVATVGYMTYGGLVHIAEPGGETTAHELGHNLGLGHGDLLWGDVFSNYGLAEYYGAYGPMAGGTGLTPASLDAGFRSYLDLPGVDTQTEQITLTLDDPTSHTVTLDATTASAGTSAATFVDGHGFRYFVELRDGAGVDAEAFYTRAFAALDLDGLVSEYAPGVVVTMMEPEDNELYVLGHDDGAGTITTSFTAGDTYADPMGQFTLTVDSTTASTATVSIVAGATIPTTMKATATKVAYGTAGKVTVTVSGAHTPTGNVTLAYGGITWTKALWAGKATFTLPSTWKPGTRTLTAKYAGAAAAGPSTTTVNATVTKATPRVSATRTTAVKKGAKATFVVAVGSSVAPESGYVQLFVGGKAVSAKAKLAPSGTVYKVKLTTWKLPQGRISVKYYGTTYLAARTVATDYYAR